jgi:pimeloyl-ACP methyl ester carboxylesterase
MRFVLIHGGYHGAWCWEKLTPELEALGHTTLAIDLPGCNSRSSEEATFDSWRGAFRDVVEQGDVLVGHSMGGFAIALGADELPDKVARVVFLSAAVPIEGEAMGEATDNTTVNDWPDIVGMPFDEFVEVVELPGAGPCSRVTEQEAANKLFYHDCSKEDQDWAWERLTPLPFSMVTETFHLPNFWSSPIPRDFIITTDDYSHPVSMDNVFMGRLGLSTAFSIVSSHSPFISRPAELARVLHASASGALAP